MHSLLWPPSIVALAGQLLACQRGPAPEISATGSAPAADARRDRVADRLDLGFEKGAGWEIRGGEIDRATRRFGNGSARLRGSAGGVAVVTRFFPVDRARGRRIVLRGWVKTADVANGYAGLWLRVDQGGEILSLDNMYDRGLRGDTDWTRVEVAADVPAQATAVAFGGLCAGQGTAWIDGLDIELGEPAPARAVVTGVVLRPDGKPAAGAIVALVPDNTMRAAAVVVADRKGRFRAPVRAGRVAVTATAPGTTAAYRPPAMVGNGGAPLAARDAAPGAPAADLKLRLAAAGAGFELAGTALDERGRPLARALVQCLRYSNVQGDIFYAQAGADGRYRIGLTHAPHSCSATAGSRSSVRHEVADRAARLDLVLDRGAPAPAAVVSWVREQAIPLASVEPGRGFDDMKPLRSVIGRARIVALGEATHGSREFFQMKHRMLEYLVSELGFTVFAIEASFPESEAVNDYVMTGQGDPAAALAGLHFWTWDTEEVRDLIEWMRRWNADPAHRRKVSFYGFDMQFSVEASASLVRFLERADPGYAAEVRPRLSAFAATDYERNKRNIVPQGRALQTTLREIGGRLDRKRHDYQATAGRRPWLVARQSVRILEQNVALNLDEGTAVGIRDRAMADNLRWIADVAEPGARVVAWAHNGHVGNVERAGVSWMGRHLEKMVGSAYLAVGFAFHRGSFQAIDLTGRNRGLVEHAVGPAPVGSVDETFHRAGLPIFMLDLRRVPRNGPVADWFSRPRPMRESGSAFSSEDAMLVDYHLPGQFEAVIFVASTTRARPNPTGRRPPRPR
jgi:erythromycin esterase